jgi:hypothetical protein
MQEAAAWNKSQKARVQSYRPQQPELPTDFACPPGQCTIQPPAPPVESTEGFTTIISTSWYATIASAALLFILITR